MKTIYSTNEWKGYGKQNYYHNEYRQDGDEVSQYKCHRQKIFDGEESTWNKDEQKVAVWNVGDSNLPGWLHKHIDK